MKKTLTSLLIYLLVLLSSSPSTDGIDNTKSKFNYGRKILVSNYSSIRM